MELSKTRRYDNSAPIDQLGKSSGGLVHSIGSQVGKEVTFTSHTPFQRHVKSNVVGCNDTKVVLI